MARIIVAFTEPETAGKIAGFLRSAGYDVFRVCSSAGEVLRALRIMHDGVLVTEERLSGLPVSVLFDDLNHRTFALILGKAGIPDEGYANIRFLRIPSGREVLLAAVEEVCALHAETMPKREREESETIGKAKAVLMKQMNLSEEEAHRLLQKTSMRTGLKMEQTAWKVLLREERKTQKQGVM